MRTYAIIQQNNDRDVISNIADKIREYDKDGKIYLFVTDQNAAVTPEIVEERIIIPEEICEKESKVQNYVIKWFKDSTKGFLYVFRDNISVDPEKMSVFSLEIEEFMTIFGYDVWLNTYSDICNFIFEKWISRINVVIDNEELNKKYDKTIKWMSNANTNFIIYNLDILNIEDVLFDETFSIAMFFIIKFFAERRNHGKPGSFMNFYPTLESEKGVIKDMKYSEKVDNKSLHDKMVEEDKLFKEMNVNFAPTEQLEPVLEFIRVKLEEYNGN